jgi:hypothetical protein
MCNAPKNTHLIKSKKNKMSSLSILPLNFTPTSTDILCGRGNVFSNHEGNRYFGRIIRANLKPYRDAGSRPEKIRVVDDILQEIRSEGVRFAKLDSETKRWHELSDVLAHQKIGHAIRDTIRLLKDKNKNNTSKPTTMKHSKIAKRKRRTNNLMLQNHVVPSMETRKKTMNDILQMSIETSEFLNDLWGAEAENIPPVKLEYPKPVKYSSQERTERPRSRFALKDEYPEESFDFSPNTFFGDMQSYDIRLQRITSQ